MTDANFKYPLVIHKVTMECYNQGWHATLYAHKVQVDRALERLRTLPHRVHKSTHGCKAYFVHDTHTGLANFLWHNPINERGYGARVFDVPLHDGTTVKVKGPWSSRSSVMNQWFVPRTTEIRLACLKDRYSLFSTHMDVKTLRYWIKVWAPEFRLGRDPDRSEWGYRIYRRDVMGVDIMKCMPTAASVNTSN